MEKLLSAAVTMVFIFHWVFLPVSTPEYAPPCGLIPTDIAGERNALCVLGKILCMSAGEVEN